MATSGDIILGIETSCDETAAAVVRRNTDGTGEILSNTVLSQIADHAPYGGVVPEIAARAHADHLPSLILRAMTEANVQPQQLSGVAATAGPGLLGGLLVGLTMAKGFAMAQGLPLIAVNHLEAHALTPRLTGPFDFPYLLLLISGGHTQFQLVRGIGDYHRLGSTIDDALGEAFDKTAKLLNLSFPGGPAIERHARSGDPSRFVFPRPLKGKPGCNFSFSGLKTSVRETVHDLGILSEQDIADVCASFQRAVADTLKDRLKNAFLLFSELCPDAAAKRFVVAGGVAANAALREVLTAQAKEHGFELSIPAAHLCTDNAAMIAWAGAERLALGLTDPIDIAARARWPLDTASAPVYGSGKLGAKA
jgi:N6-L-threonylcarbamoyladenine synthase